MQTLIFPLLGEICEKNSLLELVLRFMKFRVRFDKHEALSAATCTL